MPRKSTAVKEAQARKKKADIVAQENPAPLKPEEKQKVWQWSGWCKEAHHSSNPMDNHRRCTPVMETPSSFLVCPCLHHEDGVYEAAVLAMKAKRAAKEQRTKPASPPGTCPTCGEQGARKKRDGTPIWKCPQGHRWPRATE